MILVHQEYQHGRAESCDQRARSPMVSPMILTCGFVEPDLWTHGDTSFDTSVFPLVCLFLLVWLRQDLCFVGVDALQVLFADWFTLPQDQLLMRGWRCKTICIGSGCWSKLLHACIPLGMNELQPVRSRCCGLSCCGEIVGRQCLIDAPYESFPWHLSETGLPRCFRNEW